MLPDNKNPPGLFRLLRPLALASASPRRRDFLRGIGIDCRIAAPPEAAEPLPLPGEDPRAFAARAARAKAEAVRAELGREAGCGMAAVLGADTVVFRDSRILGKPRDAAEAFRFLRCLVPGKHTVRTACFLLDGESGTAFHGEAEVSMGDWPDAALEAYAACGEGLDKAGGYAVQGLGAFLVSGVEGSWSAVIGLPVAETVAVLLEKGVIAPVSPAAE